MGVTFTDVDDDEDFGETHEINVTPFIDVVLVLLIIFMITAPILQSGIEVDVPKTHTVAKELTAQHIVVTMDKNQLIYLGNDPVENAPSSPLAVPPREQRAGFSWPL